MFNAGRDNTVGSHNGAAPTGDIGMAGLPGTQVLSNEALMQGAMRLVDRQHARQVGPGTGCGVRRPARQGRRTSHPVPLPDSGQPAQPTGNLIV